MATLDLSGNKIQDDGAEALADALGANTTLTSLNLLYNDISPDGAKSLAEALKSNITLTCLDLTDQSVTDSIIAPLLEKNKTLKMTTSSQLTSLLSATQNQDPYLLHPLLRHLKRALTQQRLQ